MHLLCVTSNFPRWEGDSTTPFVLHLVEDLVALGWQVDVLAPHAPGAAIMEVMRGINVKRFRYLYPAKAETVCYNGGALINLRNNKNNFFKLPAFIFSEWLAIVRALSQGDYDLLHSHWILPQGFTGVLAAGPLKIPHVLTAHGGDVFALRGKFLTWFKSFALNNAAAVTVNSSFTHKKVSEIAPKLTNIHQIPMGVSIPVNKLTQGEAARLRAYYRRGNGPLLVFVGRLVEEKGVEDLVHAVRILLPKIPDVTALIIGEGPERPSFEQLVADLELADRITFLGWVEPKMVPFYLAAGDIFVGPSRRAPDGGTEAQGLVFLEAMAANTPVIATRVGGITDAVQHEETGLLVNERSPEEIAAAVRRLTQNPLLCENISTNGHRMVINRFSRESSAQSFSELFKRKICEYNNIV